MDSPSWLQTLKSAVLQVAGLKRYWKVIVGFVSRVVLLNETREARQIDNMTKYLEAVSKQLVVMKKNGIPDDVLRTYAIDLNVPLIQANLEAMIVARRLQPVATSDEQNAAASSIPARDSKPGQRDQAPH